MLQVFSVLSCHCMCHLETGCTLAKKGEKKENLSSITVIVYIPYLDFFYVYVFLVCTVEYLGSVDICCIKDYKRFCPLLLWQLYWCELCIVWLKVFFWCIIIHLDMLVYLCSWNKYFRRSSDWKLKYYWYISPIHFFFVHMIWLIISC